LLGSDDSLASVSAIAVTVTSFIVLDIGDERLLSDEIIEDVIELRLGATSSVFFLFNLKNKIKTKKNTTSKDNEKIIYTVISSVADSGTVSVLSMCFFQVRLWQFYSK